MVVGQWVAGWLRLRAFVSVCLCVCAFGVGWRGCGCGCGCGRVGGVGGCVGGGTERPTQGPIAYETTLIFRPSPLFRYSYYMPGLLTPPFWLKSRVETFLWEARIHTLKLRWHTGFITFRRSLHAGAIMERPELHLLLSRATKRILRGEVAKLVGCAAEVRLALWKRLEAGRRQLFNKAGLVGRKLLPEKARCLFRNVLTTLTSCTTSMGGHVDALPAEVHNSGPVVGKSSLRVGFGNPGYFGCADVTGKVQRLEALVDERVGALRAMRELRLDLIGLPGARLPNGSELPIQLKTKAACQWEGGSSHASVAVLWYDDMQFMEADGRHRCQWVVHAEHSKDIVRVATVYFTRQGGVGEDNAWCKELADLDHDLTTILTTTGSAALERVLLVGDFNFQSPELVGALDTKSVRRQA